MSASSAAPGAPRVRRLCSALVVGSIAAILCLTLTPTSGAGPSGFQWRPFQGEFGLADFLCNVLLFVPLGVALRCRGVGAWRAIALGAAVSAGVELLQLRIIAGRDASFSDLLSNALGAAVGAWLAAWLPVRRRSAGRGLAVAAASVAIVAGAGLLQQPSFPSSRYYGQWTANLGMYDWYRGKVLSAEIGGTPLPSWRLQDSRAVRERLRAGTPLRIRAVAGPPPANLAPLFSLFDGAQREILLVGPDRDDLVLHVRSRANDVRLRPAEMRWRAALAGVVPGDTLTFAVRRDSHGYCLMVNGSQRCGLTPTAGDTWTLLQSYHRLAPSGQAFLGALTMFLLGFPVGVVTARRGRGWAGPAVALCGSVGVSLLVGLSAPSPLEPAAMAIGLVAGVLTP